MSRVRFRLVDGERVLEGNVGVIIYMLRFSYVPVEVVVVYERRDPVGGDRWEAAVFLGAVLGADVLAGGHGLVDFEVRFRWSRVLGLRVVWLVLVLGFVVERGSPVDVGVSVADAVDNVEEVLRVHREYVCGCQHASVKHLTYNI